MGLFNRQKNSNVPPELQPYYDAPKSGPRSLLMWIIRVVVMLVILAGLIIGGLWAYHKIVKTDGKVGQTLSTPSDTNQSQAKPNNSSTSTSQPTSGSGSANQGSVTPSDDSANTRATTTPSASPSSTAGTTNTASNSPSSVGKPTSTTNLVNTGPGATLSLFVGVSAAGAIAYQTYLRSKKQTAV